jgi:Uma2 family endonuclease
MADLPANSEPELHMSREKYRRWVKAQPKDRFERIEGTVMAMAPERAGHNDLKMQMWLALRQAIAAPGLPCQFYGDGMTVQTADCDFEPDVVLHCGERLPRDALTVPEPLVVVEVLSPSTRGGDLTRKLVGYFQVPSVQHYLMFWVDRLQVVYQRRGADGQGVDTRMLTEGETRLEPPGIFIRFSELYGG